MRKGQEENAKKVNKANIQKLRTAIKNNMNSYEEQRQNLINEKTKDLERKYKSMVSRTKKAIEQEKAKSGDKAAEEAERENEL